MKKTKFSLYFSLNFFFKWINWTLIFLFVQNMKENIIFPKMNQYCNAQAKTGLDSLGLFWGSKPGPLALYARIIPLDQRAVLNFIFRKVDIHVLHMQLQQVVIVFAFCNNYFYFSPISKIYLRCICDYNIVPYSINRSIDTLIRSIFWFSIWFLCVIWKFPIRNESIYRHLHDSIGSLSLFSSCILVCLQLLLR